MKILHILRSEPDEITRNLMGDLSKGSESESIELFDDVVDYDEVVKAVFGADRVFSWW